MQKVDVTEGDVRDRERWNQMIRCGDPKTDQPKEDEEEELLCSSSQISFLSACHMKVQVFIKVRDRNLTHTCVQEKSRLLHSVITKQHYKILTYVNSCILTDISLSYAKK